MEMKESTYKKIKWLVSVVMPAFITLCGVIGGTLNLAYTDTVITILTAVNAFLGATMLYSTHNYDKAQIADKMDSLEKLEGNNDKS